MFGWLREGQKRMQGLGATKREGKCVRVLDAVLVRVVLMGYLVPGLIHRFCCLRGRVVDKSKKRLREKLGS